MSEIASVAEGRNNLVEVASCIAGVPKSYWHQCSVMDALNTVRANLTAFADELIPHLACDGGSNPLRFMGSASKVVLMSEDDFGNPEDWYFIGDLHADFYAVHSMLQSIHSTSPDFRLVFLGDLVDRGEFHIECLVLLLVWAMDHPGQIVWVAGNHDIAFSRNLETMLFASSVSPSEFLDVLNDDCPQHELNARIGGFFIALTQRLPRALLFPDGLLATHGGFPLTDLHGAASTIASQDEYIAWLNKPECLQDITWTRITRYRKRMPNRLSKGCSYGFLDFEAFCNLKPEWFPVRRMVTGHEHVPEGFHPYMEYLNNPAMTLTGLGFDELKDGELRYANYRDCLTAGRYQRDAIPMKFEVPVDVEALRTMHPSACLAVTGKQLMIEGEI